jgi:hypothetical protein
MYLTHKNTFKDLKIIICDYNAINGVLLETLLSILISTQNRQLPYINNTYQNIQDVCANCNAMFFLNY